MVGCSDLIMRVLQRGLLTGCLLLPAVLCLQEAHAIQEDVVLQEEPLDGRAFFEKLVKRYRNLVHYIEKTRIEEVYEDELADTPPINRSMQVMVEIRDDQLQVERPGLLDDAVKSVVGQPQEASEQDLWLLPHMALRFTDDPLLEFRKGIEEGFEPTELRVVSHEEREFLQLELQSHALNEDEPVARFELLVDPERMLIEKINGEQHLPNGLEYRTSLDIEVTHVFDRQISTDRRTLDGQDERPPQTPEG